MYAADVCRSDGTMAGPASTALHIFLVCANAGLVWVEVGWGVSNFQLARLYLWQHIHTHIPDMHI